MTTHTTPITREILDDLGVPHTYVFYLLSVDEGLTLGPELLAIIGESCDFSTGLGSLLSGVGGAISRRGGMALVRRLLVHASRDGAKLATPEGLQVYAGNYGELARAIAVAVELNFASFGRAAREMIGERLHLLQTLGVSTTPSPASSLSTPTSAGLSGR